jgi:hypothetical protein
MYNAHSVLESLRRESGFFGESTLNGRLLNAEIQAHVHWILACSTVYLW